MSRWNQVRVVGGFKMLGLINDGFGTERLVNENMH
jgi:hypothetical protein